MNQSPRVIQLQPLRCYLCGADFGEALPAVCPGCGKGVRIYDHFAIGDLSTWARQDMIRETGWPRQLT